MKTITNEEDLLTVPAGNSVLQDLYNPTIVPHWYMYPPKGMYNMDTRPDIDKELNELKGPVNIYVHIPFCNMKCSFCTLFATIEKNTAEIDKYIDYLLAELDLIVRKMNAPGITVKNLYFGGGTPSVLNEGQLFRIIDALHDKFIFDEKAVVSVEFSPDSTNTANAGYWKKAGFNRVSLGVQSFTEQLLRAMNRGHSGQKCFEAIDMLIGAGFTNINVDLIYNHHLQSITDLYSDLENGISSGANSLTLHPLARRRLTGYKYATGKKQRLVDPGGHQFMFSKAIDFLFDAGWPNTSAVSFASDNAGHAIEEAEAACIPTIGIGAGARTYLPRTHFSSISYSTRAVFNTVVSGYFEEISKGMIPMASFHRLNEEEQVRRPLVLGMVGRGVAEKYVGSIGNRKLQRTISNEIAELAKHELIILDDSKWRLSKTGLENASYIGAFLSSQTTKSIIGFDYEPC